MVGRFHTPHATAISDPSLGFRAGSGLRLWHPDGCLGLCPESRHGNGIVGLRRSPAIRSRDGSVDQEMEEDKTRSERCGKREMMEMIHNTLQFLGLSLLWILPVLTSVLSVIRLRRKPTFHDAAFLFSSVTFLGGMVLETTQPIRNLSFCAHQVIHYGVWDLFLLAGLVGLISLFRKTIKKSPSNPL